jgi:hypothetical protein
VIVVDEMDRPFFLGRSFSSVLSRRRRQLLVRRLTLLSRLQNTMEQSITPPGTPPT